MLSFILGRQVHVIGKKPGIDSFSENKSYPVRELYSQNSVRFLKHVKVEVAPETKFK